jgi:hypothetical protein
MLLDKVSKVETEPFPHVVIENALDEGYYQRLLKARPSPYEIIGAREPGPNQRLDMPTRLAMQYPVWGEFCRAHTSRVFWNRVFELFGEHIKVSRDERAPRIECQPGVNTPTDTLSKVRGPHLDNPKELYAGLFYMGTDDDGGNLELYRWKERRFHGKLEVHEDCVELVKTVPYKHNTFVFFINSDKSLHGVTPRKSKNYRLLVNVMADMREPLFRVGHGNY